MVGKCVQFYVKRFSVATFGANHLGAVCTFFAVCERVFSQLNGFKFEFYLLMREESSKTKRARGKKVM